MRLLALFLAPSVVGFLAMVFAMYVPGVWAFVAVAPSLLLVWLAWYFAGQP